MVLAGWISSGGALLSLNEWALSQIGTRPDMTLYIIGTKKKNK